ncbi:PLD nuclease N-terminal domain-containing protein [Curtobacterium sp. RRHDQ10]|uniref:PLD nuclease N-terminal domain-containing protein n=1 Tax=Curtobacterium phyllosphaerae TaxID=3413379 RepID=UPI003BEF91ED
MTLFYGVELLLLIVALIDVIVRDSSQVRHLPKLVWVLLIVFLPFAGAVIWFVVGHDWQAAPRNHGRYLEPARREDRFATLGDARVDHGHRRVTATEQELAALEDEIRFWEAQARLKRAKDAAGDGDPALPS